MSHRMSEDTHEQARTGWPWRVRGGLPGLRTIETVVMAVVSFPQNAQRCVSGEHPLGRWSLQAGWGSDYIRFLCRVDL